MAVNQTPQTTRPAGQPGFEASLARLEEILRTLDDGKTDLDTALARYEEGVGLLRRCHALLQSAQRRIEILRGVDANGDPVLEQVEEKTFKTVES